MTPRMAVIAASVRALSSAPLGVTVLMHMNGANNGTVFTNEAGSPPFIAGVSTFTSTAQFKFGTASVYFPGGTNYLYWNTAAWQTLGIGDFTLECWVKRDSTVGLAALVSTYSNPYGFQWYINGSSSKLVFAGGGASITANLTANDTNWNYFAVSRVAGVIYLFQNGTLLGSNAFAYNLLSSSTPMRVGSDPSFSLAGYMDELRITVGIGRYTSSFTEPAAPFTL